MKNVYIVLVGEPGIGKNKAIKALQQILNRHGIDSIKGPQVLPYPVKHIDHSLSVDKENFNKWKGLLQ